MLTNKNTIEQIEKENELIEEWIQAAAQAATDEDFMMYLVAIDRINQPVEMYRAH